MAKKIKINQFIDTNIYNQWKGYKPKSLKNESGTLDLFEIIDEFTVDKVKDALEKNPESLHIRIHSPGGYVYSCIAINSLIDDYKDAGGTLSTEVVGVAASCAGIIALKAERRIGREESRFMLHPIWIPGAFNQYDMEKRLIELKDMDETFFNNLYKKVLTGDEDSIKSYIKENRVMTTEEMKNFGVFTEYKSETDEDDEEKDEPSSEEEEEKKKKSEPESETDEDDDDKDGDMSSHEQKLLQELRRENYA